MMSVTKGIIRNSMRNSRIIKKVVNHDLLLNKLICDDLRNCNCVSFVNSLSVEDIESSKNVWLRFMKSHHKWCPVGPPGGVEAITREEEEKALEKEIMEDSWLVVNADPKLVFNKSHSQKYNLCLKLLGIENAYFSSDCGKV